MLISHSGNNCIPESSLCCCCSVAKLCLTLSNPMDCSKHARLLCPSLSPGVCANSWPLTWWCYLIISSSVAPFSCLQSFPASGSFPVSWLYALWPKYWSFSFSISPSNEYSGVISFRIDWLDLLASPRDSQYSSPAQEFESINSSVLSLLVWSNSHICTWLLEKS